jgi:hypothetical protein
VQQQRLNRFLVGFIWPLLPQGPSVCCFWQKLHFNFEKNMFSLYKNALFDIFIKKRKLALENDYDRPKRRPSS